MPAAPRADPKRSGTPLALQSRLELQASGHVRGSLAGAVRALRAARRARGAGHRDLLVPVPHLPRRAAANVGLVAIADVLLLVIVADAAQNAMAGDYKSIPTA
jgi:hypothetical protein